MHQVFKCAVWIVSQREIVALLTRSWGWVISLLCPATCFKQMHFPDALEITWASIIKKTEWKKLKIRPSGQNWILLNSQLWVVKGCISCQLLKKAQEGWRSFWSGNLERCAGIQACFLRKHHSSAIPLGPSQCLTEFNKWFWIVLLCILLFFFCKISVYLHSSIPNSFILNSFSATWRKLYFMSHLEQEM